MLCVNPLGYRKQAQYIDDLNYMINKFDLINRNLKFQNYILDKKDWKPMM